MDISTADNQNGDVSYIRPDIYQCQDSFVCTLSKDLSESLLHMGIIS